MNSKSEKLDWLYDELLLNTNNKHNKLQQLSFYKWKKSNKLMLNKYKYFEAGFNLTTYDNY